MLDVNTFWVEFKDFMYSMGLAPDIETVWAFLEEHSRTEIAEDVLDEARAEASEEAYEIGREEGYDHGHENGYEEGHDTGYDAGFEEGYDAGFFAAKARYA